jgi:transcriptional regulator with XRE-family HTH domain
MLAANVNKRDDPEVQQLRREGGAWLKSLREKAGYTQRSFAHIVASDYYTFISQIENGRGRVPPERYGVWAETLGIEPREFLKEYMRYYDPISYGILFEESDHGEDERAKAGG